MPKDASKLHQVQSGLQSRRKTQETFHVSPKKKKNTQNFLSLNTKTRSCNPQQKQKPKMEQIQRMGAVPRSEEYNRHEIGSRDGDPSSSGSHLKPRTRESAAAAATSTKNPKPYYESLYQIPLCKRSPSNAANFYSEAIY